MRRVPEPSMTPEDEPPAGADQSHDSGVGAVGTLPDLPVVPASPAIVEQAERDAVAVAEATGVPVVTTAGWTWKSVLGLVLGVTVLAGLSAAFLFFPIDWSAIGRWGYLGVAAVVFVATASVAVPIPYLLIVARAGTFLDPLTIGLLAGVAGMLGEMTGYLVGISGSRMIPKGKWYERASGWICNYGFWFIAFFACIPNPFFDAVGLAAGTLRYSWWRFALSCYLGKAVKFTIAAWIGAEAIRYGWIH